MKNSDFKRVSDMIIAIDNVSRDIERIEKELDNAVSDFYSKIPDESAIGDDPMVMVRFLQMQRLHAALIVAQAALNRSKCF